MVKASSKAETTDSNRFFITATSLTVVLVFLYSPPTAQVDISAVDVARLFRKQKTDDSNSVFQLAYISGRDSLGHCGQLFLRRAAGIEKTGGNSINRNSMGCDNAGQGAGERSEERRVGEEC